MLYMPPQFLVTITNPSPLLDNLNHPGAPWHTYKKKQDSYFKCSWNLSCHSYYRDRSKRVK